MELKKCCTTKMLFPIDLFGKWKSNPNGSNRANHSLIASLWINVSQRSVNGRYAATYAKRWPNNHYHPKGVRMAEEWVDDPTRFAMDILTSIGFPRRNAAGDRLSLDRIDNDGDYVLGNLRWATALEQAHNKSGEDY